LRLAENTGRKKVAKNRHLDTIAQLWRAISSQLRHVSTIGKYLLSSNISSRCPHNMVNFGLLAAEIVSLVWGTPANFNGLRVLAALLHGTLVVGISQTAAFNRGRHLYSAGRPSGWALAHISSSVCCKMNVVLWCVLYSVQWVPVYTRSVRINFCARPSASKTPKGWKRCKNGSQIRDRAITNTARILRSSVNCSAAHRLTLLISSENM